MGLAAVEAQLTGIVTRRLAFIALEPLREEAVLLPQGPKSVGKSTWLRPLADEPRRGCWGPCVQRRPLGSSLALPGHYWYIRSAE